MARRTKAQKIKDQYDAFKCIQKGVRVKREGTKDGSIATHPVVEVIPFLLEAVVLRQCMDWFNERGILANRHDAGSFQNIHGQWGSYGIKGAGDIIGCLKNGRHYEVEVKKSNGGRLSLEQQKRRDKVIATNGVYLIIHGMAELEYLLEGVEGVL